MNAKLAKSLVGVCISTFLASCSSTQNQVYKPQPSYLEEKSTVVRAGNDQVNIKDTEDSKTFDSSFRYLKSLDAQSIVKQQQELNQRFSDTELIQVTSDKLEVSEFIHYVFGDVLGVSYIVGDKVDDIKKNVTLNVQDSVSKRKLFTLTEQLLAERGIVTAYEDGVYFLHQANKKAKGGEVAFGYGNKTENVPNTSLDIIQIVPIDYGVQSQIDNVLKTVANVKVTYNQRHNAFMLQGKRKDILRSLEFLDMMDRPGLSNRHVGVYQATFTSLEELVSKLPQLLKQDGVTVGLDGQINTSMSFVQLETTGTLVVFANSKKLIDRAVFWAKEIDKPLSGDESQYFIYQPKYSRASDLGISINALFGIGMTQGATSVANENSAKTNRTQRTNASASKKNKNFSLVVDERANALVFDTTGEQYRKLLPLIKRLDVSPKQVVLEVFIAEVTLTDEFKQGVEFAFQNGAYSFSTSGAFGVQEFGGLSYILEGANAQFNINAFQSNSLVNVLSKPSLVVRDGVSASISVGTEIPVVGSTSQDPINGEKETTQIDYRKTGVELSVTPTVNAQGVIIMEIDQSISNQVDGGSTVADSPSIFERTIKTEVVAESGQTVILGGLISENDSDVRTKVPVLGDIPLLGALFRADNDTVTKTELIIMVTPKIIEKTAEWEDVKTRFTQGLNNIVID